MLASEKILKKDCDNEKIKDGTNSN